MSDSDRDRRLVADARELRRVEHAVARILAQTDRPVEVYKATLEAVGRALDWGVGLVWELDVRDGHLHCVRSWHRSEGTEEFEAFSQALVLEPGEGLPGRVLTSGRAVWMVNAPEEGNFPRAVVARRSGLHAGFGFPLRSPRGVVGVIEFFSHELRELDERLLATMDALGSLVGQVVERRRAEEEVRASESRLRAMLESALDAVVSMDHEGRVIGWNPAAEATFGYPASEAIGADMAELIVPPALRAAHRRGLKRFRETQHAKVLDRRLELTGMRRDGTEFPVELTITRIGVPGPPTFTAYLRDITERIRAVQELRASRARVVEVADAERMRIQRNLHDGAQQRLTAVLLNLGRARASPGEADALIDAAIDELAAGLEEIRQLASGLHPSMLAERGLSAALEALAMRAPVPVQLDTLPDRRLPDQVEAAAYYVVAEALANVDKHAGAGKVVVRATADRHRLVVAVHDDGVGGADRAGSGLRGLADRVEALGGQLSVDSPAGVGTRLRAEIPCEA
jgi:PAS domain S-box-containing protein